MAHALACSRVDPLDAITLIWHDLLCTAARMHQCRPQSLVVDKLLENEPVNEIELHPHAARVQKRSKLAAAIAVHVPAPKGHACRNYLQQMVLIDAVHGEALSCRAAATCFLELVHLEKGQEIAVGDCIAWLDEVTVGVVLVLRFEGVHREGAVRQGSDLLKRRRMILLPVAFDVVDLS